MSALSSQLWAVIVPLYALLLVLYVPALLWIRSKRKGQVALGRFCRGLAAIMIATPDNRLALGQVNTLHKTLAARYDASASREFGSTTAALENLLVRMDTSSPKDFKELLHTDPPTDLRARIVSILDLVRQEEPFATLTSKQAHLLMNLQEAVATGNTALANTVLAQMGDEIQVLEDGLARQKFQTQLGFSLSAVGVILTLFFGVISFLQFLSAS